MKKKKIVLAAINAKYIHSNLAVYSLYAYAEKVLGDRMPEIVIKEYTINQTCDEILGDLFREAPDLLAVSCYLWNISMVEQLVPEFKKVKKELVVWYGGPEVSYHAQEYLSAHPYVDGIMVGEGEETFAELLSFYQYGVPVLEEVKGLLYRTKDGTLNGTPVRPLLSMDELPFPYKKFAANKIIYYETSRGCPFSCSYCLSSVPSDAGKRVRIRSLSIVGQELSLFLREKVPQVKFIDRTFNCNREHSLAIWNYIKEHDNGVTNFHFEIAADLLDEEEISLLSTMRKGLVQLEIGVQSANMQSIHAVCRKMDLEKVKKAVAGVRKAGNIHQHLDLIAGLPYEDYTSFCHSFDEVYRMQPEQLQLGFLKVLKGTRIEQGQKENGIIYRDYPPYEVLQTKWISYQELLLLKDVEEMTEAYYNSGQFKMSLSFLLHFYKSPYQMYAELAGYYRENALFFQKQNRMTRYDLLLGFLREKALELCGGQEKRFLVVASECLTFDWYGHENAKSRPLFSRNPEDTKERFHAFYEAEAKEGKWLSGYGKINAGQLARMTHMELFTADIWKAACEGNLEETEQMVLFDYKNQKIFRV